MFNSISQRPIDRLRSTVDRNHGTRAVRGAHPLWSKDWAAVYANTVLCVQSADPQGGQG
jgi:hypothetical protein